MAIKAFNRPVLRTLDTEINTALEGVAKKYGISLKTGSASFSENSVTFKLEGTIVTDGVAKTKTRMDLELFYPQYVDKQVKVNGKHGQLTGTVVGYKSRAKKYPFIVETAKGRYKMAEQNIR